MALRSSIAAQQASRVNVDSFIAPVRKHTDIRELNTEIIREFVEVLSFSKLNMYAIKRCK